MRERDVLEMEVRDPEATVGLVSIYWTELIKH